MSGEPLSAELPARALSVSPPTPADYHIVLPHDISPALLGAVQQANPRAAIVLVDQQAPVPAEGFHREAVAPVAGILGGLAAGAVSFLPPPWGLLAGALVKVGLPAVLDAISKAPAVEHWTIDMLLAAPATVAMPQT